MSATGLERVLLTSGSYRLTEEDSVQAAKVYGRPPRALKIIDAILASGLLQLFISGPTTGRGIVALGALLGGIVGVIVTQNVIAPALKRRAYRRNTLLHNDYTVAVSGQDIRIFTVKTNAKLTGDLVTKWQEGKDQILIYVSPRIYFAVPKRVDDDGFNLETLRSRLRQYAGEASR